MKRNTVLYIVLAIFALTLSGCAGGAAHTKYRGQENYPGTNMTRLDVNPNVTYGMTAQQRDAYYRNVAAHQAYVRDASYTNAYAAYAEKQWVNDPEGGPPLPPGVSSQGRSKRRGEQSIFEEERNRFLKRTSRTFTDELSRAMRDSMRDLFR